MMLEIGSIVLLKEGQQKLMIINRNPIVKQNEKEVIFDYSACLYPVGLSKYELIYFNEENVEEVVYHGFHDEEEDQFQRLNEELLKDNSFEITKGSVTADVIVFAGLNSQVNKDKAQGGNKARSH